MEKMQPWRTTFEIFHFFIINQTFPSLSQVKNGTDKQKNLRFVFE